MRPLHPLILVFVVANGVYGVPVPDKGATNTNSPPSEEDADVEQLHNLKPTHNAGPTGFRFTLDQRMASVNHNGHINQDTVTQEKVTNQQGQLISRVNQETVNKENGPKGTVTQVDIPSENVHQVSMVPATNSASSEPALTAHTSPLADRMYLSKKANNADEEYYVSGVENGLQYTPTDMAQYILKTGDDQGVTLAIEELVKEGLMSRYDATAFLEDVNLELQYLTSQLEPTEKILPWNIPQRPEIRFDTKFAKPNFMGFVQPSLDRAEEVYSEPIVVDTPAAKPVGGFDGLVERLKVADYLYNEYSLEEVIYQLAKEMFSQSIVNGNNDAEQSLQRFSQFLQREAAAGKINQRLEKKVLDVMMSALVDTISEHPEMLALQPGPVIPQQENLRSFQTPQNKLAFQYNYPNPKSEESVTVKEKPMNTIQGPVLNIEAKKPAKVKTKNKQKSGAKKPKVTTEAPKDEKKE